MSQTKSGPVVNTIALGSASISSYAAMILAAKLGLPLEAAAALVGLAAAVGGKLVKLVHRLRA